MHLDSCQLTGNDNGLSEVVGAAVDLYSFLEVLFQVADFKETVADGSRGIQGELGRGGLLALARDGLSTLGFLVSRRIRVGSGRSKDESSPKE